MTDYMRFKERVAVMTNSESIADLGPNSYGQPTVALNILRESILGREAFDHAFKAYVVGPLLLAQLGAEAAAALRPHNIRPSCAKRKRCTRPSTTPWAKDPRSGPVTVELMIESPLLISGTMPRSALLLGPSPQM